jgi:DNA-binding NtrC family response regulator
MPARSGIGTRGTSLADWLGVSEPGPRILIVEDDLDSLDSWMTLMAAAGYRVTGANSFEQGRHALRLAPDVLVTDVRLGAYNGLQLIIRGRAVNPRLRAIVVTGYPDTVVKREAEALDAVHLAKPVDPERLLDEVAHALEEAHRDRAG